MTTSKKEKRRQVKELKRAHEQRAKLIDRVSKARAKYEKRSQKLQAVESRIAELSREIFGDGAAPSAADGQSMPPAKEEAMSFGEQSTTDVPDAQGGSTEEKTTELPDDPAASE
jgi:hypothetical protein